MNFKDIGTPYQMRTVYGSRIFEVFCPDLDKFRILMEHLEKVGGWNWNPEKPTRWDPAMMGFGGTSLYVRLNPSGMLAWANLSGNACQQLAIEWGPSVPESIGDFCSCVVPNLVKSFSGFGAHGVWFDHCRGCGKERR